MPKGEWTASKRMKANAAAAAAAGAAAGAAAASQSQRSSGRKTSQSLLRLYRAPRRPSVGVMKWGKGPFPENLWTEVVYAQQITLTSVAGAPATHTYCLNGLYDPDITTTGGQPRYFDTLCGANNTAAPYNKYVVKAARAKVIAFDQGPDSAGVPTMIGLTSCPSSTTAPNSIGELMQRNDTNYGYLGHYYGGKPFAQVTRTTDIAATLGVKDLEDNGNVQAQYNANPSNLVYLYVVAAPMNQSSEPTIVLQVEIRYWVKFFALNDVPDS